MVLQALLFYPVIAIIFLLSLLPLRILYFFSDFLYLVIYYLLGYRKTVVRKNLSAAFPSKSSAALRAIEKAYYRHLSDLVAENVWSVSASRSRLLERCHFADLTLFDRLHEEGKDFIVVMGHLGNWEWSGLAMSACGKHELHALYRPLKNTVFNRFFMRNRSRFGAKLIPMQMVAREMLSKHDRPVCTTFIADQSAPPQQAFWTTFLQQETPFFKGYEALAMKFSMPVVFVSIVKEGRGRYIIHTELMTENAANAPAGKLPKAYSEALEAAIQKQPAYWLWSHKRWKHRRPATIAIQ